MELFLHSVLAGASRSRRSRVTVATLAVGGFLVLGVQIMLLRTTAFLVGFLLRVGVDAVRTRPESTPAGERR